METVILVVHLMIAVAIIVLILLQRSSGGGLGIGGGGGGMGDFATARSTASALTKATTFCAILFFCTSLGLGILAKNSSKNNEAGLFSEASVEVNETVDGVEAVADESMKKLKDAAMDASEKVKGAIPEIPVSEGE